MRRAFGNERATKIALRLQHFRNVDSLEELRNFPGKYHELTGDRKGSLAVSLDGPYRLIFRPDVWVEDSDGRLDWSRVTAVVIDSITDYH